MASTVDLTIVQGQDGDGVRFPVAGLDGELIDVTGWTVRAQARRSVDAASPAHEWVTGDGHTTTGPEGVTLTWTGAQTAAWCADSYAYQVEITDPDGRAYRLVEGRITLDRELVR